MPKHEHSFSEPMPRSNAETGSWGTESIYPAQFKVSGGVEQPLQFSSENTSALPSVNSENKDIEVHFYPGAFTDVSEKHLMNTGVNLITGKELTFKDSDSESDAAVNQEIEDFQSSQFENVVSGNMDTLVFFVNSLSDFQDACTVVDSYIKDAPHINISRIHLATGHGVSEGGRLRDGSLGEETYFEIGDDKVTIEKLAGLPQLFSTDILGSSVELHSESCLIGNDIKFIQELNRVMSGNQASVFAHDVLNISNVDLDPDLATKYDVFKSNPETDLVLSNISIDNKAKALKEMIKIGGIDEQNSSIQLISPIMDSMTSSSLSSWKNVIVEVFKMSTVSDRKALYEMIDGVPWQGKLTDPSMWNWSNLQDILSSLQARYLERLLNE